MGLSAQCRSEWAFLGAAVVASALLVAWGDNSARGADCNNNGVEDAGDVGGASEDCNGNSIPDECEGVPFRFGPAQIASGIHSGTQAVASGDVDGDGLNDVITASRLPVSSAKGIQVTLVGEDGTFSTPRPLEVSAGRKVYTIALADVDLDGDNDIVTASVEMILVFFNDGAARFGDPVEYATAPDPDGNDAEGESRFAITADLTGDGAPEIIAANRRLTFLSVFPNNGDGTFGALANYPCGDDPQALTAADFDGNGTLDIAAVNKGTKDFAILLNNGDGTLREPQSYPLGGATPVGLEAGDLNGDGHLDLVTVVRSTLSLLMSNGDGTFGEAEVVELPGVADEVAAADFDRDGDIDIAVHVRQNVAVVFMINDGKGGFPLSARASTPGTATALAAAELSGDKEIDIVVTLSDPEELAVLSNGAAGELPIEVKQIELFGCQGPCRPHSGAALDLDGDGDLDLVGASPHPGDFAFALNDGRGNFETKRADRFGGESPMSVKPGDFDFDGDNDLVTSDISEDNIWVHENTGDGRFLRPVKYRPGPIAGPINLQIADFDGDGDLDAATANLGSGNVSVMFNDVSDGTTSLGGRVFTNHGFASPRVGQGPKALAVADFDNDGDVDIASANSRGRDISVLLNAGDGSFESVTTYGMGSNPNHVTHGDLDGDGRVDLVTANQEARSVSIFRGLGNGTFANEVVFDVSGAPYSVEVFDFDLDGNPDALTANEFESTVSFLAGDGKGGLKPPGNFDATTSGIRFLLPGDYDADGDLDFVAVNRGRSEAVPGSFTPIFNLSTRASETLFVDSLCTHLDFHDLSLKAGPTSPIDRFLKYIVPASDEPGLIPTTFQNSTVFELHIEFLREAFPEQFGALTADEYTRLVERRVSREYYVGSISRLLTDEGELVYGFNFFARFDDPAERPTVEEAREIYDRIKQSFHLEPLVYFPENSIARELAEEWTAAGDPGFPILVDSTVPPFEPYTGGVSYGRVRLLSREKFEEADSRGRFTFQDGIIVEHAPRDIQGIVAFVATGERQGELSHLSIRTNRRGTPNCLVKDALEVFAPWDGKLVRFEVTGRGFLIEEATQEDAEAFWRENRPSLDILPAIDEEYAGLPTFDEIVAMEDAGIPIVPRVGGKASNLARLRSILTGEWTQYQENGFTIPVRYYLEFMRSNRLPSALDPARDVTYEAYLQELFENPEFQSNPSYRFDVLDDLRDHMREEGVVDPELVEAVAERALEVMGTPSTTRVRFRSSSNIEDDVQFNGAGLYDSTSGCIEDELDGDEEGPSHCDPEKANERTITRALKRVWRSLWNFGAFEERNYFQISQDDAAMAVLVNRTFIDEASNGVAFTGNPQNPFDRRYVITVQQGEESVVSPEPGIEAEKNILEIVDGAVNKVIRSLPSTLVPPGTFVVSEEQLEELGRVMAYIDANFPVDAGELDRSQILLDMEFKFMQDGEFAIKQVRPFLLTTSLPPPPTFELEIPVGTVACGVLLQARGNRTEYALKAQVRFVGGVHELPAGAGAFSGELFEELVIGQDRLVALSPAAAAGPGTFRVSQVSSGTAIDWTVTYRFDFEQEMTLPGGESLFLKLDNVEFVTRSSDDPIPLRRILDEDSIVNRGTFFLSTEVPETVELSALGPRSEDTTVDIIFGSCTHHTLPLFEIRAELADGTSLLLEERYDKPPEGMLRDLSAAALTHAEVIFTEARLEVSDYWNLSYTAVRHNANVEYWVVLDPAVSVAGVEKPVRVVELVAPQPVPPVVERARYLGEDFEVLSEIEVLSFERSEAEDKTAPFRRGDVNQDGAVAISDAQTIVSYLFGNGDPPACQKSSDTNDNGETTVTDAVEILLYLFRGGDTFPSPFAECGRDGTDDPLSCRAFVPCK